MLRWWPHFAQPCGCSKASPLTELEAAWDALLAVAPPRWHIGQPSDHPEAPEHARWILYAFDPDERAVMGVRSRAWEAVASTKLGVVVEMTRCLQARVEGRVPK